MLYTNAALLYSTAGQQKIRFFLEGRKLCLTIPFQLDEQKKWSDMLRSVC